MHNACPAGELVRETKNRTCFASVDSVSQKKTMSQSFDDDFDPHDNCHYSDDNENEELELFYSSEDAGYSDRGNDVFCFCPATAWFVSVVGVKMMLMEYKWQGCGLLTSGNLIKRVAVWNEGTLAGMTKTIVQRHIPPKFAQSSIEMVSEFSKEAKTPITLHLCLLLAASKEIRDLCDLGVGKLTLQEVRKWFQLMKTLQRSDLYLSASKEVQQEFSLLVQSPYEQEQSTDGWKPERPFFNFKLLFLGIAHMVYFYTTSSEEQRIPPCPYAFMDAKAEDMETWRAISGRIVGKLINIEYHGIHVSELADAEVQGCLGPIMLPYRELKNHIEMFGLPDVSQLHHSVMTSITSFVQSSVNDMKVITNSEREQLETWTQFASSTVKHHICDDKTVKNREKVRRHFCKNRNQDKMYNPVTPNKQFQRDVFLFGENSHFSRFLNHKAGSAASEFCISLPPMVVSSTKKDSKKRKNNMLHGKEAERRKKPKPRYPSECVSELGVSPQSPSQWIQITTVGWVFSYWATLLPSISKSLGSAKHISLGGND